MINVVIDGFTPCLTDAMTGEVVQTEVVRVVRRSFLRKYNKSNGWFVDWASLLDGSSVYALVVEGSVDIQGLVAVADDPEAGALYVSWMCASPANNKLLVDHVRYLGVGGHLFAIAAQLSVDHGHDGLLYGYAANEKLLRHYLDVFGGEYIGMQHPYHFAIGEEAARAIIEEYDYEWTDGKI